MPKRKRDDNNLQGCLTRFETELQRALKTAKAFERQRQSKRARDPATTPEKKARIEREVAVLKTLNIPQTGKAHLSASILKHKPIAAVSEKLPESVRGGVAKPEALSEEERVALHNVTSNLYNQPRVRAVVEKAVLEVCRYLRVEEPRKGKQKGKENDETKTPKERLPKAKDENVDDGERSLEGSKRHAPQESEYGGGNEWEELGGDDGGGDDDNDDGGAPLEVNSDVERAEEALLEKYDKLLGNSSDSDDQDDDDDDNDSKLQFIRRRSKPRFADDGISLSSRSPTPEADLEPSVSPGPEQTPPPKKTKKSDEKQLKTKPKTKQSASRPGISTFIPSLMGGYVSGSESEASDVDVAPPKKRLGQRQRQAIWEKKYGAKANHVKKQMQRGNNGNANGGGRGGRDTGWDMRRGAVGEEEGQAPVGRRTPWKKGVTGPLSKGGESGDRGFSNAAAPYGQQQQQQRKEGPIKDAPLHPSWAAKAKQKEMEAKAKSMQGCKAKKVVFDD